MLPSPNGSALSFRAAELGVSVVAASLRNAAAVGLHLAEEVRAGDRIAVIAAGERWSEGHSQASVDPLRPALEDLYGAGAVVARTMDLGTLNDTAVSPEALTAAAAFRHAEPNLDALLKRTSSGRELIERHGWVDDVTTPAMLDHDHCVPTLRGLEYSDAIQT